jgi:hypothetical protein
MVVGAAAASERPYVIQCMALHPAEEATLRTFVVAAKRDRLLTLFGSPKSRKQALDALNHFADWDVMSDEEGHMESKGQPLKYATPSPKPAGLEAVCFAVSAYSLQRAAS